MMTKLMLIATLTLTICMTIGAVAQTNLAGADVKVTIPFNFYAGDQSLPAGIYVVKTEIAHRVIILRGEKTPGLFVTTNRLESTNRRNTDSSISSVMAATTSCRKCGLQAAAKDSRSASGNWNENWLRRVSPSKW